MLTMADCIACSDLTEGEIGAIAEHEHVTAIVALEFGQCLIADPEGRRSLAVMICEDIELARGSGDKRHVEELVDVLQHYLDGHPDAGPQR